MKSELLTRTPSLLLVTAFLLLPGCARNETIINPEQIVGSGRIVTETRSAPGFTGIRVTNYARVFITQDTVQSLRVEADDNILNRVQSQVAGGILIVGLSEGSYSNVTVIVHATIRNVTLLESTGAADFSVTAPITANELLCRITGTGTITLNGTAARETVEITGAGTVRNFGLAAGTCSALISGAGGIEVTVSERLDATILGTGSITYAGNPAIVNRSVMGVGSIKPL